ncbi:hypothetical protein KP509_1Z301000 [Ceratopteris richardii]|nr:hypothetical protein KP509_1Z301000 [Ceratopteris richardii]
MIARGEKCQQSQGLKFQNCRACFLCTVRCEECGRCINDNDFEETFSLDLLCSCCWLRCLSVLHAAGLAVEGMLITSLELQIEHFFVGIVLGLHQMKEGLNSMYIPDTAHKILPCGIMAKSCT